jgi:hypothetical protein
MKNLLLIGTVALCSLVLVGTARAITVDEGFGLSTITTALNRPYGIAVDTAGNVYVSELVGQVIDEISPAGQLKVLAGTAGTAGSSDGTGASARFNGPEGLAVDTAGNVYVADTGNNTIRKITPAGVVTTLAGTAGVLGFLDGAGATAQFARPAAVTVDATGNLYVADGNNLAVRKITPGGVVSTVAVDHTDTTLGWLQGIALDALGNIYVSHLEPVNPAFSIAFMAGTIDKITPGGVVTVFAGQTAVAGDADGTGTAATFFAPVGLSINQGYLFVATARTIRQITAAGVVTTVAGTTSVPAGMGDGSPGILNSPMAAVAVNGTLYIADLYNNALRRGIRTLATDSSIRFVNLSTRGTVSTGGPLIAGFVVEGTITPVSEQTVLLRAVGPTLTQYGVSQPLAHPVLTIYGPGSVLVASSTGVLNATNVQSATNLVGAFPLVVGAADSALVITLPAGAYTAVATAGDAGSGTVMLEAYEMP